MNHKRTTGRGLGEATLAIMKRMYEIGSAEIQQLIEDHQFDPYNRRALWKKLYYLEHAGYIKKVRIPKKNHSFFHLTPKGRFKFLKYLHLEKIKKMKWDGYWRVIIFDIPETLKKWREFIRPKLKELGFHPLQESVYITPYPVTKDLDDFLEEWNMRKYFRYLSVNEIDDEDELKEIFGLE